ncbi:MAG: lipid A deacylase LpxR family protein [Gammaproteobacteria bacterium]
MRLWGFCCWLIISTLLMPVAFSQPDVEWDTLTFTLDNDLFILAHSDGYYTNGLHVRLESKPFDEFNKNNSPFFLLPLLPFFPVVTDVFEQRTLAYEFGQAMVTPADITISVPQPDDLPYGGLLYAAADLNARNTRYADTIRFMAGVVGPWSQADEVQQQIHRVTGSDEPNGWEYQLENEFVVNMMYERRTSFHTGQFESGFNYQWVRIQMAELGTINTGAEVSLALLITEQDMKHSHNLQSSIAHNAYLFSTDINRGFFAMLGVTGRLTLRNIFLDGNTFSDSPSVEKELWSGGIFYGIGYATGKWNFSASWVRETKRFETQEGGFNYGSITVTYRY